MTLTASDFQQAAPVKKPQGATRVSPLGPDNLKENTMPKLKTSPATPPGASEPPLKKKRKYTKRKLAKKTKAKSKRAAPAGLASPRFGIFEDGSVQVATASCKGSLDPSEAAALVEFIARLRGAGA